MLFQCWSTVFDAGPTSKQHWMNAPCWLGSRLAIPPDVRRWTNDDSKQDQHLRRWPINKLTLNQCLLMVGFLFILQTNTLDGADAFTCPELKKNHGKFSQEHLQILLHTLILNKPNRKLYGTSPEFTLLFSSSLRPGVNVAPRCGFYDPGKVRNCQTP